MNFPRLRARLFAPLLLVTSCLAVEVLPPSQDVVTKIGVAPLKAPVTADFSPSSTFTMEGWFYMTSYESRAWLMGKERETGGDPFISFGLTTFGTNGQISFSCSTDAPGSYASVVSPTGVPLKTWFHCAAVMNGSSILLYINGVEVASGTANGAPKKSDNVAFGVGSAFFADGSRSYALFPGFARSLRFWSVARTAVQIAGARGERLPQDTTGLVAAWPLDQAGGSTAADVSGAGRSLTVDAPALATLSAAMLELPPFFTEHATAITDGSINYVNFGHLIDFNSDGAKDLVVGQVKFPATWPETRVPLRAFRNQGGNLVDSTSTVLGDVEMVHPFTFVGGDFDGDGRQDLFVGGSGTDTPPAPGEQSVLLLQTSDGRLSNATATHLPQDVAFTHNAATADIDGDGDLDLFLCNIGPYPHGPRVYVNDGHGHFEAALDRIPADITNLTTSFTACAFADVNGDGFPDLVLGANLSTHNNEVLINDHTGHFVRDATRELPLKLHDATAVTVKIAAGDLNGDGWTDLLLATGGGQEILSAPGTSVDGTILYGYTIPGLQVLLNKGDGTFADQTDTAGFSWRPGDKAVARVQILDLNGDGRLDVLVAMPISPILDWRPFLNISDGNTLRFREIKGFLDDLQSTQNTGILPADMNADGVMDYVVAQPTKASIWTGTRAPLEGRLSNLSVRSQVGVGANVLITGFYLKGSQPKPMLVRAGGPSLDAFKVPGFLVDPVLAVHVAGPDSVVASNDNWGGDSALLSLFDSVGAFHFLTEASLDAALGASLAPGGYTEVVSGKNETSGVALAEIYDAGSGNQQRLTNVSARTNVGTGADVLIAGFVVNGTLPKRLLIRAAGPSLDAFKVPGFLADPVLQVRREGSDSVIAANDDWAGDSALKGSFASVGAFNFLNDASKDAALAVELAPGAYTAMVSGKDGTTGVALAEVYELP